MEAEKPKIDIGFIKTYLESCIKWETQKRIAEETFNELTREENQWKQKMSYMVKKQHSRVSVIDMLLMAGKGFGIWLIILLGVVIVYDFFDNGNILVELLVSFVLLATMFVLVIGWPIYEKVTDYISIRNKFVSDQQREKNVKQQGNNALYIIQNNKDKLRQAYGYIINNLKNTYSANLIYKKYQTVEACAAIFEYLESGRCYTLEGP